jgi:ATP-dependent Clp protease, protease subunit
MADPERRTDKVRVLDPDIRLFGAVDDAMFESFTRQLNEARKRPADQVVLVELTTTGGDAETGRRIAADIALCRREEGRVFAFLGKSSVYSAGITIMSAFPPEQRWLTDCTELLIHERRITRTVELSGALRANRDVLQDEIAEIDSGVRLERAGFEQLVKGTPLGLDALIERVNEADWYLSAAEAHRIGLVRHLVTVYGTD